MLDCKYMNTPMVTKLKLLNDDSSDIVDVIISIDYWIIDVSNKYETICMFFCKHIESVYGGASTCSPNCNKTCDEVP